MTRTTLPVRRIAPQRLRRVGVLRVLQTTEAPEPHPRVVEVAGELQEHIAAGKVCSLAIVTTLSDRSIATVYALGAGTIADLVLGLEYCKERLLAEGS